MLPACAEIAGFLSAFSFLVFAGLVLRGLGSRRKVSVARRKKDFPLGAGVAFVVGVIFAFGAVYGCD